jgi:purine-cytosine permease-like protein
MNSRSLWSRVLVIIGSIAMLAGALDPLEVFLAILIGSGLVALGTFFGQAGRQMLVYWIITFSLITFGVVAMFVLSAVGGIGGTSGHSLWWGVLVLPYPVGWVMGIVSLLVRLVRNIRHRNVAANPSSS